MCCRAPASAAFPLVSVNTPAVTVDVFRIGDRNLINTVIDSDFQRALSKYELSGLGDERGVKVWSGELATATTLNQDVTTAFPVDQALGDLQPGVYVMTAAAKGPGQRRRRLAGDAVVHRFRSRPHRVFRQ